MITTFDAGRAKNASMQALTGDVAGASKKFACMATISGETEMREIIKNCPEDGSSQSIAIPIKHTVTLSGRFPVDVIREVNGLDSKGLVEGVFGYGPTSKGKNFILALDLVDEFEDVVKKVAYPKCTNIRGLAYEIDNEADEYGYAEFEIVANAVTIGGVPRFYVETFVGDSDESVSNAWADFAPSLVAAYNVLYNGNGADAGEPPVDVTAYRVGDEAEVEDQGTLLLTGKVFDGWNTSADGSGTAYAALDTITMAEADITLYAQWIDQA